MDKFETTYKQMLEMVSGDAFGDSPSIGTEGGSFGNADFYAPDDARVPKVIGAKKKCKKKSGKKEKECGETIPIMRRAKPSGM